MKINSENLYEKTVVSGIWNISEKISTQILQLLVSIILARILLPEQFGMIAILMVFVRISQIISESGFSVALIQKSEITEEDRSTVFFSNIFIAIGLYLLVSLSSPFVASFYNEPQLSPMLKSLSTVIIIGSFSYVQCALFNKQLNFKALFFSAVIGLILSAIVGISMALKGYGVWSLVGQQITLALCRSISLWVMSSWRPKLIFCFKTFRTLFTFSSRLMGAYLLTSIFDDLYTIVIGKFLSPTELGYYARGRSLPMMLMNGTNSAIGGVVLPVYSKIQGDLSRLKIAIRRTLQISLFFVFPLMAGLFILADPLISVLLTDKWLPCAPVLKCMCFYFVFFPIHIVSLQGLAAIGRSDIYFRVEIIKKALALATLFLTFKYGIFYMAVGQAVLSSVNVFIHGIISRKYIHYSFSEQFKDIIQPFSISIIMCAGVFFAPINFIIDNDIIALLLRLLICVVIYLIANMIIKSTGLNETMLAIRTLCRVRL